MAKQSAVYAPGELTKVRDKLGNLDEKEAKRMAQVLGGEVGYERNAEQETARSRPKRARHENSGAGTGSSKPTRRVEILDGGDADLARPARKKKPKKDGPADNPAVPIKASYWDRVRMDRYCGQPEFGIKNAGQVLASMFSILNEPPDLVSPSFVNKRMNEYYKRIELLVTSVRSLLPRGNAKRAEKFRRLSSFAASVLDTMRYWNIEQISSRLSTIQAHPRNAATADFTEILREIYRPLYVLELLNPETHIKNAFKLLYRIIYLEDPAEAKTRSQELIRTALSSYGIILRDIRFQLYPLLMKLLSSCLVTYDFFFQERKNRIKDFLQVTEQNRINPQDEAIPENPADLTEEPEGETPPSGEEQTEENEEKTEESPGEEETAKPARDPENKALKRGLATLEVLFPRAGWDEISFFPDFYPYFSDALKVKKVVALIAPTDPLHQIYFLSRIVEELFFGLRFVSFGAIKGSDGSPERIDEVMGRFISDWQKICEASFEKEYLPRLDEYCRLLENTAESKTSNYAKRLMNELHWAKRLYFLPYYKFDSIMPPPFQKNASEALYPLIRSLRRYLTAIAAGIEQGNRQGGAESSAPCDGIENPWDAYVFQVPNPVSKRLDALLGPKKRNNASLIFFALAVMVVLDHLVNNENSWAYNERMGIPFRSENDEGSRPLFGVEGKVDTETIFKQALKKRQAEAAQAETEKKAAN
jgi:hypothetical protein